MASRMFVTKRLKQLREQHKLEQKEFVDLLAVWLDEPVSLSFYQKWEQGQKPIQPIQALELARFFKVNPSELVERR